MACPKIRCNSLSECAKSTTKYSTGKFESKFLNFQGSGLTQSHSYLTAIHPTFPVLAKTKARVQSLLCQCPSSLQDAFCEAFLDFTRPYLQLPVLVNGETTASAHRSLLEWELDEYPRTLATELVYFQTTVMMALDQDRGRARPFPQTVLISKARGIGVSQKLHLASPDPILSPEFDPDSDHSVALRAWWVLVAFDRWHAIATGVPTAIGNDTAVLLPGLKLIVGDGVYQLLRKSLKHCTTLHSTDKFRTLAHHW